MRKKKKSNDGWCERKPKNNDKEPGLFGNLCDGNEPFSISKNNARRKGKERRIREEKQKEERESEGKKEKAKERKKKKS